MNFLAHIHLSGNNPQIKFGNFIGDFVKGSNLNAYPEQMQKGIKLHRFIDSYTDSHESAKKMSQTLKPATGRFAPVYTDIFIDHILATNWEQFSNIPLHIFIKQTYAEFNNYSKIAPRRVQQLLPSLQYNNWMGKYISFYGLEAVLSRMAKRTIMPDKSKKSILCLKQHYAFFEYESMLLLNDIIASIEGKEHKL